MRWHSEVGQYTSLHLFFNVSVTLLQGWKEPPCLPHSLIPYFRINSQFTFVLGYVWSVSRTTPWHPPKFQDKKATSVKWFNLMNFSFKRVVQPPTRYGKLSSSFCKKPQISHVFFCRYICEPYLGHTEIRKSLKKSTDWYRECSVFQDTRSWWNVRLVSCLHVRPAVENDPWTSRHFLCFQFKNIHSLETKRQ